MIHAVYNFDELSMAGSPVIAHIIYYAYFLLATASLYAKEYRPKMTARPMSATDASDSFELDIMFIASWVLRTLADQHDKLLTRYPVRRENLWHFKCREQSKFRN